MNTRTTSNPSEIFALGLNQGKCDELYDVETEPSTFSPGSSLGWGQEWHAEHWCNSKTFPSRIQEEGLCFVVENGKPTSYKALLKVWRECLSEREE